jgi:hypothetical protein
LPDLVYGIRTVINLGREGREVKGGRKALKRVMPCVIRMAANTSKLPEPPDLPSGAAVRGRRVVSRASHGLFVLERPAAARKSAGSASRPFGARNSPGKRSSSGRNSEPLEVEKKSPTSLSAESK